MGNTVGIVGGGAAGMMAAIAAARGGAKVTLLEGNDRPLLAECGLPRRTAKPL